MRVEPGRCTVGSSTNGLLCVTEPSSRKSFPNVFYKGQPVDKKINEALQDYHADTVIIKGANAFDLDGHVGIITSGFNGGTVPNFIGYMTSKGLKYICPVGYEKLVPSVPAASRALGGASHIDISMGADPGLYCLSSADIITEVEAIRMMFHCDAKVVCAGGIGGNEGAHYWAVDGEEADIKALVEYLEKNVKGEPPVKGNKGNCANCRYPGCRYNGLQADELPAWMKKVTPALPKIQLQSSFSISHTMETGNRPQQCGRFLFLSRHWAICRTHGLKFRMLLQRPAMV